MIPEKIARIKLSEVLVHLAHGLHEPLPAFTELARALREGLEALAASNADLFGELDALALAKGFRSKSGVGGGSEIDATGAAFFLTAFLADVPRREVAAKALSFTFAAYQGDRPGDYVCPVTQTRFFGAALKMLLTDRAAFDRASFIRVSADGGSAEIVFKPGSVPEKRATLSQPPTSWFWVQDLAYPDRPSFRERVLRVEKIAFLFDLINAAAKAKEIA
jgi:hypothetical protein